MGVQGGEVGRVYQLLPPGVQVRCQVAHAGMTHMMSYPHVWLRWHGGQVELGGSPRVRWRSTAFGGEVVNAALVTITLWGSARKHVWNECTPITFLPLSVGDEVRGWWDALH